jgi:hypothetical protein
MTDQAFYNPPLLPATRPRNRWRWLTIIAALSATVFLAATLAGKASSLTLEITRVDAYVARDGKKIDIVNVGTKPIAITSIAINDRTDCLIQTDAQAVDANIRFASGAKPDPKNDQFVGSVLKVGDKVTYTSSCRVIRALVDTDQGREIYSFQ